MLGTEIIGVIGFYTKLSDDNLDVLLTQLPELTCLSYGKSADTNRNSYALVEGQSADEIVYSLLESASRPTLVKCKSLEQQLELWKYLTKKGIEVDMLVEKQGRRLREK